ncbi:MAG: aspartate kinase [Firmicutes bacterium]|nr:aspartate kinase [Bacillota bacterium]
MSKIIIQKFGGTSVASQEQREKAALKVLEAQAKGYSPVVVVSAMGRKGEPYATDTLLGLMKNIYEEASPREQDLLMSCGEIISAVVMTQTLRAMKCQAVGLTGGQAGIITDETFGDTRILQVHPGRIKEYLAEGTVVVVAGFQGMSKNGEVTTLGRGGSDTTAAALGVSLKAELVEIYTDVDGVMTADPKVVPEARPLEVMSYSEIVEMAHLGAKVVHPRAVEIAMEGGIPIKIKSTFSDAPGTLVCDSSMILDKTVIKSDRVARGVAHLIDITQIKIDPEHDVNEAGFLSRVFRTLADAKVSVDLISVLPKTICFIVNDDSVNKTLQVLNHIGLKKQEISVTPECAKVSVVGAGMRGVPGVMAKVVETLADAGVKIYQTSDSHASISCLVMKEDILKAAQRLHTAFNLGI